MASLCVLAAGIGKQKPLLYRDKFLDISPKISAKTNTLELAGGLDFT